MNSTDLRHPALLRILLILLLGCIVALPTLYAQPDQAEPAAEESTETPTSADDAEMLSDEPVTQLPGPSVPDDLEPPQAWPMWLVQGTADLLWLMQYQNNMNYVLAVRQNGQPAQGMTLIPLAATARQTVRPGWPITLAAAGDKLYLGFHQEGEAQPIQSIERFTLQPRVQPATQLPLLDASKLDPPPPHEALLGFTATPLGPCLLVRESLESQAAPPDADDTEPPSTHRQSPQDESQLALYRMTAQGWRKVDLPDSLDPQAQIILAAMQGPQPQLILATPDPDSPQQTRIHTATPGQPWSAERYDITLHPQAQLVTIDQQITLVQPDPQGSAILQTFLLRNGRVFPMARFARVDAETPWQAAGFNKQWYIFSEAVDGQFHFAAHPLAMPSDPDQPIAMQPLEIESNTLNPPSTMMLLVALPAALILFTWVYRRHTPEKVVQLPEQITPARLSQRFVAGLIDLLLPAIVVGMIFDFSADQLIIYWISGIGYANQIVPTVAMLSFYALHTGLSELIWKQSLGKKIVGIRITDNKGQPVSRKALLIRNAVRLVEIVVWPMFLLVLMDAKNHQRLGDLAAQTVVVNIQHEDVEPDKTQ